MSDSFSALLFCFRISKGLSEKVFAKSEAQKTTAEDVEDAGRVKLFRSFTCDLHLGKSRLNLQIISCTIITLTDTYIWQMTLVPHAIYNTFHSARFLGLN